MPYKNLKEELDEHYCLRKYSPRETTARVNYAQHIFRKIKDAKSDAEASKILSEMERRLITEEKVDKNEAARIRNEAHKLYIKHRKKATSIIASELIEIAKMLS